MLSFDLRWILSAFFLLAGAAAGLVVWTDRRRSRRQAAAVFDTESTGGVLERAPFG